MSTSDRVIMIVSAILVLYLTCRFVLLPKLEIWRAKYERSSVDYHCHLALVKALWVYRKDDLGLEVPNEVMRFLKTCFRPSVLDYALSAAQYGHVDIYISSWNKPSIFGSRGIGYKHLKARFEEGEFAGAYFTTR